MDSLSHLISASIFRSWPVYGAASATLLVAELVYVLFGFGVALIAIGVLAMVMHQVTDVVVLLGLVNLPLELWIVVRDRRVVLWRGVLLICLGIGAGVPLGTWALGFGDARVVLLLLGGFLVLVGLIFLGLPRLRSGVRWPRWSAPLWGLAAGVLGGLFGTSGPPLILYYRLAAVDKDAFRGSLMAIFLVISLLRFPSYGVAGLITWDRVTGAALVFPAVLLGALLGNRIHVQMQEQTFQRLVALGLLVMGALLLVQR